MKKPFYKKWWFILIVAIIVLGAIGNTIDGDDKGNTKKDNPTEQKETVKKDDSKKDDTKKEVASTDAEVKAKDVEIYKDKIAVQLDAFQDEYDKHWNNIWAPTFKGVSEGTVDKYKAYESLNSLKKYYTGLNNKIGNTDLPKLSKENQKVLEDCLSDFKNAVLTRSRAASEAAEMFDTGTFKPSEMDKIKSTVGYADQKMLSAMVNRTTLEQKLGLIEQK